MTLLVVSFLAGILTTFAPCILPLLPVIIGGGISSSRTKKQNFRRGLLIVGSLGVSVIIFTLLLKATTALLGVPQEVWRILAGGIVLLLGINYLFPRVWQTIILKLGMSQRSNATLYKALATSSTGGAILTGAALGPVFTSCSPTYALIVAAVLPASFFEGLLYLVAYVIGMAIVLLLVIYLGQKIISKLGWALNEHGIFHKVIGIIFVIVGIGVILGFDKSAQTFLLERGVYDGTSGFEESFQLK